MTTERSYELAVDVRDVTVSFSRWGQVVQAIDDTSISVRAGEWVLLVGPNGAGKSTLLKTIGGQLRPERGRVTIFGASVNDLVPWQLARAVFLLHQDPLAGTAPLLTVFENLLVADSSHAHRGLSRSDLLERYVDILQSIGLDTRMQQPVKLLSGGERQLLALAIARLREANVILLDEPLAALDPVKTELCIAEIERMHAQGKTIIQVAHETRLLRALVDRVIVLTNGRLAASASETTAVYAEVE
jgi:putative tryptophan/tyrosine transport system ATP-binding protein